MEIIHCDWLKTQIALFRDQSEAIEVLKEADDFFEKYEDGTAGFSCGKDGTGLPCFFIFIGRKPYPPTTQLGLIVHEVSHLVDILLDKKGIETRAVNTEVRAHMNEWLFNEVSDIISRQEKKTRKRK
jgi:hypothetical protein